MKVLLPTPKFRSNTAMSGDTDLRDENVFSAVVVANGGTGNTKIFLNPIGQPIPALKGTAITVAQPHQTTYTEVTTNLTKAGELGSALGDAAVRAIGVTFEQAGYHPTTGAINTFGATPFECSELGSKLFCQFQIANKGQIQGPVWMFPASGAIIGSFSTTVDSQALGIANNGPGGSPRRLKLPIMVGRTDTLIFTIGVVGTLVFRTTTGEGAATLLTVNLASNLGADVR